MKKFFYVLMAAAALVAVSCDKEGNDGNNEGENGGDVVELAQPTHRIKTMTASGGDVFTYSYNANGTVASVEASYDGEAYGNFVFNYEGTKLTVVNTLDSDKLALEAILDKNNHAVEVEYYYDKSEPVSLECAYDKDGFLVSCKVNGELKTIQNIVDGNVDFWTRKGKYGEISEDADASGWRKKLHTYYAEENIAGIHTEWNEDVEVKRWVYETGIFGRASVNVCKTAHWWGVNDDATQTVLDKGAEKIAYYPLNLDTTGCVGEELKLYDTVEKYESAPDTMGEDGKTTFTCEPIAK